MFSRLGAPEILLIVVVVLLLFGAGAAKKLPGAAKSVGESMRVFKREMKQMRDDRDDTDKSGPRDSSENDASSNVPRPLPSGQREAEEVRRDRVADR
jgi:sec-independent protein translocase protein TatA